MKHYQVKMDTRAKLHDRDVGDTGDYRSKEEAAARTEQLKQKLDALRERLYAEGSRAVLVVLQGIDTGGKDGTIRHVMSGVNPQGCIVTSFKAPSALEKAHDFLWRIHAACPPRGYIGIFNRSHYEDVLITRVHGWITDKGARHQPRQIREFERTLTSRVYRRAFDEALSTTSTDEAPWFVVPADHKWYRNLVVADCLAGALQEMDPRPPKVHGIDWKKLRREVSRT